MLKIFQTSRPLLAEEVAQSSFQRPIERAEKDHERSPQQRTKRKAQCMSLPHFCNSRSSCSGSRIASSSIVAQKVTKIRTKLTIPPF